MKKFLERKISWKIAVLTTIIFALFIAMILPRVASYTEANVGGLGSPDTELLLSGEQLYNIAESYGEEGRSTYILLRWTFDVVWPIVYMMFLLSFIIVLGKGIRLKVTKYLYLLPIVAAGFDYLENTMVTIIMLRFPIKMYLFGTLTSYASLMKWITLNGAFLAVVVIGVIKLWLWVRKKKI